MTSVNFHTPEPAPELAMNIMPIEAVMIEQSQVDEIFKKIEDEKRAKQREERRKAEAAERKKQEERERRLRAEKEKQRQAEARRQKAQAAAEAKKREAEKRQAEAREKERLKKEAEKKKAEEIARKEKEKKEKARKEAEEKAKREAEKKMLEAEARRVEEQLLQEQLQAEQAIRSRQRRQQVLTEVQRYTALISNTIKQKWIVDDSMKGTSCRLNIKLASNGLVVDVKVLKGSDRICRASENAVLSAVTLPVPKDPEVFEEFRSFNLTMSQ
ncbi:cell envelope integrity protein TolA [Fluctibacter corallii]|uniref:cell envelope integrity protein TolA n=1 Tax=Fluctibacter corallii TaxID=2984329 RepID=UPI0021E75DBB|nr:cell envelope integrity protein TolA [Aestuariibacter sp. AA17]